MSEKNRGGTNVLYSHFIFKVRWSIFWTQMFLYATKGKSKQLTYIVIERSEKSVVIRKIQFQHKASIEMLSFVSVLHQIILYRLFLEKFYYRIGRLLTESFAFLQKEDMCAALLNLLGFHSSSWLFLQAKIGCLLCMLPALYAQTSLCIFVHTRQVLQ